MTVISETFRTAANWEEEELRQAAEYSDRKRSGTPGITAIPHHQMEYWSQRIHVNIKE